MTSNNSIRVERHGFATLHLCDGVQAEEVLTALSEPGESIKNGDKRIVRRVGNWTIKSTRTNMGIGPLKMTANRARYRNGWKSSLEMMRLGLRVPKTVAYVEFGMLGVIWGNALVYEYLDGCLSAPKFLKGLKQEEDSAAVEAFFQHLGEAVVGLAEANVFHRDLKLDNVLTQDGETFFFIDLDEAHIGQTFQPEHRMRNHIQMANGLSRIWQRPDIDAFLKSTTPEGEDTEDWVKRVWKGVEIQRGTRDIS